MPENRPWRTKRRWCYLFGGAVYKFHRGAFRIFFPNVFNWMTNNCVQGLLTMVCAQDCLSISVKWRLYFLISEIRFSDIGKWPNVPILVNQHDESRYREMGWFFRYWWINMMILLNRIIDTGKHGRSPHLQIRENHFYLTIWLGLALCMSH